MQIFFLNSTFFKLFVKNITTKENKPDIIIVVETHISDKTNAGYSQAELRNILPGYRFFHIGRKSRKGGGVGIFTNNDLHCEAEICKEVSDKVKFSEEQFENIVIRIPGIISTERNNCNRDLIIAAVYRQPNSNNIECFMQNLEKLLSAVDKKKN